MRSTSLGLLAVTESGLFLRAAEGWQALGLAGRDLLDVASLGNGRLVASSRLQGLFESDNGGQSWLPLASNFGGFIGAEEAAWALLPHGGSLLATHGYGFSESVDGGRSWALRVGQWGSAGTGHALSAGANGEIWFGGQNAVEELVLARWRPGSLFEWSRLMPSPSVVCTVKLVPGEPQRVLACGEGGIVQSRNDGRTWARVLVNNDSRFYFDVLPDPVRPRRWVSAGYRKTDGMQPLRVEISDDDGENWYEIEHPDNQLYGGVLCMNVELEFGRAVYRFGLRKGGVARVQITA